jgi:hypothetical protein
MNEQSFNPTTLFLSLHQHFADVHQEAIKRYNELKAQTKSPTQKNVF